MILYQVTGNVARITLNRPEKRNALNDALIGALGDALEQAAADSGARVVLLTGAGKDFCSGADLAGLDRSAESGVMDHLAGARRMAEIFRAMRRHPKPIVAVVKGRALAGGCGLATACDLILAAESAQFGYPEINIGFIPAMVMAILRRSVSEKRAFELITTGEILPAPLALSAGLVNRVLPDAELDAAVEEYVARLARKPPAALALCKNLLYHMDGMTFEAALEAGIQGNALARQTDDCKRGIEQFRRLQPANRA